MQLKNKAIYNFDTLAPAILGSTFKNAKLLGTITYEMALERPDNIALRYRQIFPSLPPGTPDTPENQQFFVFRTESGQIVVICDQWISESSVVEVQSLNFSIDFTNMQLEDQARIRDMLLGMGYANKFSIK